LLGAANRFLGIARHPGRGGHSMAGQKALTKWEGARIFI
jgi:hypothetical protein